MTIKHLGGVFGRNPTFNDVTIEGTLTFDGAVDITTDLTIDGVLTANGLIVNGADSIGIDDYILHNGDSNTKFGFPSSDTFKIRTGGQDALFIDSTQKVGIGNSNPLQPLHVSGVDGIGIDDYIIHNGDGNTKFGFSGADTFKIRTGGQDAVYVDSSQNLLVGTTNPSIAGANLTGVVLPPNGASQFSRDGGHALDVNRKQDGEIVRFRSAGGIEGSISISGSTTSYNTSSDERLKENIIDAPSASDDIDAIQVRSFDWIKNGEHQKYGMVAQELQSVAPNAVTEGDTEEDMMSVDYSKLVPMMLKEIQSLRARVAQLEGES